MSPVVRRRIFMWVVVPFGFPALMLLLFHILPERFVSAAFLFPMVVIAVIGLVHGYTLPEDYLAKWTKAHGIQITEQNRNTVRRYLLRGRRIRATGAVLGYVSFSVYEYLTRATDLPVGWVTATFAGYLLGAAAAEVWAMRPERTAVRMALLTPRAVADYLPRWAVYAVRFVPVATLAATVAWQLLPPRPDPIVGDLEPPPDFAAILVWTIGSVVLALFVEATARRVVRRPQPAQPDELVMVDDAIRSTALHGLYGAGLALILGALARTSSEVQGAYLFAEPRLLKGLFFGVALISGLMAPLVWLHLGVDQPWVVRRGRAQPQVAS